MKLISDMDINQSGAIPALLIAFDYINADLIIKSIYDDICNFSGEVLSKPYNLKQCSELDIIWGWLVCMFGDYGVAPRSGWIEDVDECKQFLSACVEFYEKG